MGILLPSTNGFSVVVLSLQLHVLYVRKFSLLYYQRLRTDVKLKFLTTFTVSISLTKMGQASIFAFKNLIYSLQILFMYWFLPLASSAGTILFSILSILNVVAVPVLATTQPMAPLSIFRLHQKSRWLLQFMTFKTPGMSLLTCSKRWQSI